MGLSPPQRWYGEGMCHTFLDSFCLCLHSEYVKKKIKFYCKHVDCVDLKPEQLFFFNGPFNINIIYYSVKINNFVITKILEIINKSERKCTYIRKSSLNAILNHLFDCRFLSKFQFRIRNYSFQFLK